MPAAIALLARPAAVMQFKRETWERFGDIISADVGG
jgi:hypothetical protein